MTKRFYLLVLSLVLFAAKAKACDECGSSITPTHYTLLWWQHKNYIGVRYRYQDYNSLKGNGTSLDHKQDGNGFEFNALELWGQWTSPIKGLSFNVNLPYVFNKSNEGGVEGHHNGLGDISLGFNFDLINTLNEDHKRQLFRIGGGVKAPTGIYKRSEQNDYITNLTYQQGTGDWSFFASADYLRFFGRFGLTGSFNYRYNRPNIINCQYGNRVNGGINALWQQTINKDLKLTPSLGVYAEQWFKDTHNNVEQRYSGGYSTWASVGLDVEYKNIQAGLSFQTPVVQDFKRRHFETGNRVALTVGYGF